MNTLKMFEATSWFIKQLPNGKFGLFGNPSNHLYREFDTFDEAEKLGGYVREIEMNTLIYFDPSEYLEKDETMYDLWKFIEEDKPDFMKHFEYKINKVNKTTKEQFINENNYKEHM